MVLANGAWQGKQIVPGRLAEAIDDARRHHRRHAALRLALVSRRTSGRHAAPRRTHDRRHRLGRSAPVPRAGARPRGRHECRQLPPADHGAGPHRHHADPRPGAAGTVIAGGAPLQWRVFVDTKADRATGRPPPQVAQFCGMNSSISPPACSGATSTRSPSPSANGTLLAPQQRLQRPRALDGDGGADHGRQFLWAP